MTETEIAYTAGLFEGEGCIYISPDSHIRLQLVTTDKDVVERFLLTTGIGSVYNKKMYLNTRRQQYIWQCSGANAVGLLQLWLPWFGLRRRTKALEAMEAHLSGCKIFPLGKRT